MGNRATFEQVDPTRGAATAGRRVGIQRLRRELGAWSDAPGPRYRQLARALAAAIERGALAAGARLPAERGLAEALHLSRGTVVTAYDLLVAEALIYRRHGSGTFVADTGVPALPPDREGSTLVHRLVEASAGTGSVIDLSLSVVHDAEDLDPVRLQGRDLRRVEPATGYTPWGTPGLRAAIATHVTGWGLPVGPDQVVVTTGAQQAISAAVACWVRPGDTVVVEELTYPGALATLAQAGARVIGVPVDAHGVRVPDLAAALERRPALVYLQGVHSPTGAVLADRRRREIAALVAGAQVPLVEDAALVDLTWVRVPPPVAAHAPGAPIALVGSLSKSFWGGLRIGFAIAPAPVALRLARVKATHDLGSSVVSQLLAEQLLHAATTSGFADRRRAVLAARAAHLGTGLTRSLPSWSWTAPRGGLSIWVRLPFGASGDAFARVAAAHGVLVAPPRPLQPPDGPRHLDGIRLSCSAPEAELDVAVERLRAAWTAFAP